MTSPTMPHVRPRWKLIAKAQRHKAHMNLRRAVSAERDLSDLRRQHEAIPRVIRIVCRMLRGRG